jgi:RNA polymerase sigma factor (sigma-70 family)
VTSEEKLEEIGPLLWLIVNERVGNQTWLLEDAHQEAVIAAWTRLEQGYSIGIAVHKAKQAVIDLLRGGRQTGSEHARNGATKARVQSIYRPGDDGDEYVIEPEDPRGADEQDRIDAQDALRRLLSALPAREREMLYLTYWEGLTSDQVGERFGMTGAGVRYLLKRAIERLRAAGTPVAA